MVRTFLCHPFSEPKAFTDQYEPTATCYTSDDRVIVGSTSAIIHIHNLKRNGCPKLHKFSSVGIPVKLLFSENEQFIVSQEIRLHEYKLGMVAQNAHCQARIYLNVFESIANRAQTPLNNGYSSTIKSNSCHKYVNTFIAIDLNAGYSVTDISLCPITNNVALSTTKKLFIYSCKKLTVSVNGNEKDILDFFRIIEIQFTVPLQSIILLSNWIAIASKNDIRVLQVFLSQPEDQNVYQAEDVSEMLESCSVSESGTSVLAEKTGEIEQIAKCEKTVNESVSLDSDFVVWEFNQQGDVSVASLSPDRKRSFLKSGCDQFALDSEKNVINLLSIEQEAPYVDKSTHSKEITGPIEDLIGHPIHCSVVYSSMNPGTSQFYRTVSCVTLLYRRFISVEMSNLGGVDYLHSLQWLPVFTEEQKRNLMLLSDDIWPWNMFDATSSSPSLFTLALFFSTGKQGFLYDLTGGISRKVADYSYTSDCTAAIHTRSFLYVVNQNGLEAYTSRLYALAANHYKSTFEGNQVQEGCFQDQKDRTGTELFTETNYFGSYVTVKDDGSRDANDPVSYDTNVLPVYPSSELAWSSPSLNLDVCLVGMYLLQNICSVGCSTSFAALLVKEDSKNMDKNSSSNTSISSWSMHVLEKASSMDFYNELMKLVEGNEATNPSIYYHLSNEAHLMLRSELVSGSAEEEEIKNLLKESALKMADFLSRCPENFPNGLIPKYYEMAGLSFNDVIQRYLESDVPKEQRYTFGKDFLEFVNTAVFGEDEIDLDKDCSEFILRIYLKTQPSLISTVILKSHLKNFSQEIAMKFLNKYKKKQESKGKSVAPFDDFCLAVMHMQLGNPGQAEEILRGISHNCFQKLCVQNCQLLFGDVHRMTPLAQLIKKRFKSSFTAVLVALFDSGNVDLSQIGNIFKKNSDNVVFSAHVCKVYEVLINDGARKKHFMKIVDVLIDQYVLHLEQISKGVLPDHWKNSHNHVPKGNGHFSPRFSWLDKLHPFTGEPPSPQDCVMNKANNSQKNRASRDDASSIRAISPKSVPNNLKTRSEGLPKVSSFPKAFEQKNERVYCPCCCCSEVLLKFQSLLCSRLNRKELSSSVLIKIKDASFVGKESLLVLCWPRVDNPKEAVEYMLKNYASATLQYAKEMFDWKAQWQVLLHYLLSMMKNSDYEQWNHDTYIDVLKGVLLRLSRAYTASEFLSFLPSDGSIDFFLPYLHECWEFNKAGKLKQQFLDTYKTPTDASD